MCIRSYVQLETKIHYFLLSTSLPLFFTFNIDFSSVLEQTYLKNHTALLFQRSYIVASISMHKLGYKTMRLAIHYASQPSCTLALGFYIFK